jgi:hypothetical protein
LFWFSASWESERGTLVFPIIVGGGQLKRVVTLLGMTVIGLALEGSRRPKVIRGSESHQLSWLSTPKYPCRQDSVRDDDDFYRPIKKEHTVRNYQMTIKGKRK